MSDLSWSFQCSVCGEQHRGLPELAFDAPLPYNQLPEDEQHKAKKSHDLCSIDDRDFFVRGVIALPIVGDEKSWGIGAWVSLKKQNYERYIELFNSKDVSGNGPYFGWLSNRIVGYPETYLLKTRLHLMPAPERPFIELEPTEHPLAVHQRKGISMREIQRLIERTLHASN